MKQAYIQVGILSDETIRFSFSGKYTCNNKEIPVNKEFSATCSSEKITFDGRQYESLLFEPSSNGATFCLYEVTIGVNFHWERKNNQYFQGKLQLLASDGKLIVINIIPVEDYLVSVISSEISATASLEFLKAHAVISRSWLLAQIEKNKTLSSVNETYTAITQTKDSYIRWYDREDHQLFDVCADDHCQRYQGIPQFIPPLAKQAVSETHGEVLMYENVICDARFSKCCGGMTEEFQYAWEPVKHPYLTAIADRKTIASSFSDLSVEENATNWIRTSPEAFCNTSDKEVLSQVLNDFDQETTQFYRWKVEYTQLELASLIASRSGINFGEIIDLIPIERGKSGRLTQLKIVGSKHSLIFGKELEIRRILSTSHLYSSAFVIDKEDIQNNIPQRFILTGAGWGHGVGLCQIGAAVMGEKGYKYDEILTHYFSHASIEKRY